MAPARRPVYGIKIDVENFVRRLLQDCVNEATVGYWLKRAEDFDGINPGIALACRRHAWLLSQSGDLYAEDVANVLDEIPASLRTVA